jgi:DNA-binding MarR family transcriptional regulator
MARLVTHMRRLCSLTLNKRLAVVGCNIHEYAVLFRLATEPEVPQHELAYDAAIDPAAASRLVQSMSRAGLVTTRVHPSDKRQRFVKITPKGRTLERTLSPVVDDALDPLLSGLTPGEEQQLLDLLSKSYDHAAAACAELDAADARGTVREPKVEARPRARERREEGAPADVVARAKRAPRRRAG